MKLNKMMAGIYAANCYVYYDEKSKDAVIVDPGGDAEDIWKFVSENSLNVLGILLTHGHADHIAGIPELLARKKIPIYCHSADEEMCRNSDMNFSSMMAMGSVEFEPDFVFKDGDLLNFGSLDIKVLHTPGHTRGSCCFEISEGILSGDTLFQMSVGRTDLYGGSSASLINSIRNKLFSYPDETQVFPGHGANTMIGYEKKHNPFL